MIHNILEVTLEKEKQDLRDLIRRDPTLVEGYSEEDIERSIKYQISKITDLLSQVIKSNDSLPLTDQYDAKQISHL